ncbi:HAD-superfamily hydrolase [Lichtheimia hyalospora FSU 10163]|nr:HAD-superfamily hydrolase [Lichtheimia hyalospora FSU 10163]
MLRLQWHKLASPVTLYTLRPLYSTPCRYHATIVDSLRSNFNAKKQEHIQLAKRDQATILSVTGNCDGLTTRKNYGQGGPSADVYGLGITSPNEVFINNELNLRYVNVYGFDYDYTLANYTDNLSRAIYDILKDILVDMMRYPKHIKDLQFDPTFAIRGLHFDVNKGWLMKIDNYANIQLNTVHQGRVPVYDPDEVIQHFGGTHISPDYLANNMFQLSDLFSVPQACLLSDILQYFKEHDISFHPRYLSDDVGHAARILHTGSHMNGAFGVGGRLHMAVIDDISQYLEKSPKLVGFIERLRKHGKKTFLLTNSSLPFIDQGMKFLTSNPDWRDLFDVVIVSARKPEFYRSRRPFRRAQEPTWDSVNKFEPGEVYQGGNLTDFSRLTGWSEQNVLYFGDHVFSDLIDPTVEQGWRTGAIIHELDAEIQTRNTASYRHTLAWLIRIENMINEAQTYYGHEETHGLYGLINEWREQRRQARHELRNVFNSAFGSVFRTYHNPTYFAGKIRQFADIYMSSVTNLEHIPMDYVFYPDRTYLPHERLVESLIDTGRIKELLRSNRHKW